MKLMHWAAIAALLLCAPVFGQQSIVVPGAPAQTIQVPQDPAIAPLQKAVADQKAAIEAQAKQLADLQALIAPPPPAPPAKEFPVLLSVDPRKGLSAQTSAIGLEAYGITSSVGGTGAAGVCPDRRPDGKALAPRGFAASGVGRVCHGYPLPRSPGPPPRRAENPRPAEQLISSSPEEMLIRLPSLISVR